jgi:hypothetical protein
MNLNNLTGTYPTTPGRLRFKITQYVTTTVAEAPPVAGSGTIAITIRR